MLHHQRHHQWGKNTDASYEGEKNSQPAYFCKRSRLKLVFFLSLSLLCCYLVLSAQIFTYPSFSFLNTFGVENGGKLVDMHAVCASMFDGTICCDRSGMRSDICFMKGDVRTHSYSSSVFLYSSKNSTVSLNSLKNMTQEEEPKLQLHHEKIKPYTRKWETSILDTITELDLVSWRSHMGAVHHPCEVHHDVPAIFFSTGGYTGNLYHEFNDGIIPLYITSQHMNRRVVFVILEYHEWWLSKYGDVVSQLSDHPPVDFNGDKKIHCFPEAIVGLRIHDELTVDSSLMRENKGIQDFRNLLDRAYWPRIRGLIEEEKETSSAPNISSKVENSVQDKIVWKPKLAILSRNESRAITNMDSIVKMAEEIGFQVEILHPERTTELAKIYRVLNSSSVMMGVHGAAMTHFLFLKPRSVFIQVIPLGVDWAAETYFGEPARKLGLKYIGYKILPSESSLYSKYDKGNPILSDPQTVAKMGWEFTKLIYLDEQNVKLELRRFKKPLVRAYEHASSHSM